MMNLFSDELRRDPYAAYDQARATAPLFREPRTGLRMVFDYDSVRRVLSEHDSFSSRHGPADWMIFQDPPRHTKLRALVSKAFTPRSVIGLEPRIREIARELLDPLVARGEMDLARDFAVPLPMAVITEMLGIPMEDRARFARWNDVILRMSYVVAGSPDARAMMAEFQTTTGEMDEYLTGLLAQRGATPRDDLLTRLSQAEIDGERLSQHDILGFFQLLLLAGSETTTNLINNAIICFIEHPRQLELLRSRMGLLPSAIEEVLRYRAPLQWMFRLTTREVMLHGQTLPAGSLLLAMIGSANRDPKVFPDASRFDITRDPNPHLAFGHGNHFCLGAPLARLEARVALTELLERLDGIRFASDTPWEPRKGLHVHGPTSLPIRFAARTAEASHMTVLETDRLRVRQWQPEDAALLRPIVTDPRVLRFIGKGEPWSDERIRRFIDGGIEASRTREWVLWPVELKETGAFIGFAGFNGAFAPDVEIGWWLAPDYWGRGLATEVGRALLDYGFRTFNFPRVISVAQPANIASIAVMKKLGMRFERQFVHEGIDVVSYVANTPRLDTYT